MRLTCELCKKTQPADKLHRTYSRFTKVVHLYCKDLVACDKRRGVIASRRAA